jgi:tetratricopeptide (TPR) repeat protein
MSAFKRRSQKPNPEPPPASGPMPQSESELAPELTKLLPENLAASLKESPFVMERIMREVRTMLLEGQFDSLEQARTQMKELVGKHLGRRRRAHLREDPLEQAQEYAYLAMEADDGGRALELAEKALELDPDCLDAMVIHAFETHEYADELIGRLNEIVGIGQDRLGGDFFSENAGNLWAMVEARPYLRAIKQLAELLWEAGYRLDAVDHQGNSRPLLASYLTMGELGRTREIIEVYRENDAFWHWAQVLELFLSSEEAEAKRQRAQARRVNHFVEDYLTGRASLPERLPSYYTCGEESEAVVCGHMLCQAWASHPEAMYWLLQGREKLERARRGRPGQGPGSGSGPTRGKRSKRGHEEPEPESVGLDLDLPGNPRKGGPSVH